jgi:protease I
VAVVVPGGRAPEYIRNDADCHRIIRPFYGESKPVAQVCHGPLVAAAAGVLSGRRTSAYPALAQDVRAVGGEFVDGDAVVDDNVGLRPCLARPPDLDASLRGGAA